MPMKKYEKGERTVLLLVKIRASKCKKSRWQLMDDNVKIYLHFMLQKPFALQKMRIFRVCCDTEAGKGDWNTIGEDFNWERNYQTMLSLSKKLP